MAQTPDDAVRVTLSPETVQHLLWYYGDQVYGRDGGHFVNRLIWLIIAADQAERDWIAERFPEYVHGVSLVRYIASAVDLLRTMAKRHEAGLDAEAPDQLLDIATLGRAL